jgi:hypothetical protein
MRKLILGLLTEFPNSPSWRFVPETFEFPDPINPWVYPELITTMLTPFVNGNFIGVKIGDLSGSVGLADDDVVVRSPDASLQLDVWPVDVKSGERVDISFYPGVLHDMLGVQFTLALHGLDVVDVSSGQVEIGSTNIGMHHDALTMSWSSPRALSIVDDEVLFTLSFVATKNGNLSEMLALSSELTAAEAYIEKDGVIEIIGVNMSFEKGEELLAQKFQLFQNTPNPFSDHTIVGFTLPEAGNTTLTLFDIHGRVVYRMDKEAAAGYNEVALQRNTFNAPGVWYYRLDAGDFSATRKCVVVK